MTQHLHASNFIMERAARIVAKNLDINGNSHGKDMKEANLRTKKGFVFSLSDVMM